LSWENHAPGYSLRSQENVSKFDLMQWFRNYLVWEASSFMEPDLRDLINVLCKLVVDILLEFALWYEYLYWGLNGEYERYSL
jgi:hypothetical protein